jgi:hypothetical protein
MRLLLQTCRLTGMRQFLPVVVTLVCVAAARPSLADDGANVPASSHKGQFGLALRTALSFRLIATYDGNDYCGERSSDAPSGNSPVCLGRGPFGFDFEFSYGAGHRFDAMLDLRVGVEKDFSPTGNNSISGPRSLHFAPGLRYFFAEGITSKLFTTAQVVLDVTNYQDSTGKSRGVDIGLRNMSGLLFDINRRLSAFIFVGETVTAARWLRFEIEGGFGVQARYP